MNPPAKKVIEGFYDALRPGGYIFLGHSESVGRITSAFTLVRKGSMLVYTKIRILTNGFSNIVVDDSKVVRFLHTYILQSEGYEPKRHAADLKPLKNLPSKRINWLWWTSTCRA